MESIDSNLCAGVLEMIEQTDWTLQRIRGAYAEILKAYNALFPIHSNGRRVKNEIVWDNFDPGGDNFYLEVFPKKFRKNFPRLKKAADQSGNAQTWHAGESLDDLRQGMKGRVNKALEFGI